ncbi:MAG: DNRLRE domain-containing protein [Phycisphaerae bacterium]|jgi:hypothetical protein
MPTLRARTLASLVVMLPAVAVADVVTLSPQKDNTLFQDPAGSLSDGLGSYLYTGMTSNGSLRRGLIAFNLAAIPAGSTITDVRFSVRVSRTITATERIGLHRMRSNWGEGQSNSDGQMGGGGGAAATLGDATWTHAFFGSTLWTSLGGDFEAAPSASQQLVGTGIYTFSGPGLVQDVQSWLAAPSTNFGWAIIGNESVSGSAKRLDSRNTAIPANRPSLVVTYTPIPAPASLAVLLLAAGRRSRRR